MPPKKKGTGVEKPKTQRKKAAKSVEKSDGFEEEKPKIAKKEKKQTLLTEEASIPKDESSKLGKGIFDKDTILISSWNVNGIRAVEKNQNLTKYLKERNPDILCLNELKIDEASFVKENLQKFFPKDYSTFLNFCKPPQKGYAGSGIITKYKPISVQYDLKIPKHDKEGRTVTLEFDKFYLVVCYVPNAGQKLDRLKYRTKEWDPDFLQYLNKLKEKKHVILCGDLNCAHHEIDIANPKGNLRSAGFTIEERTEFTNLLKSGFVDTFRELNPKTVKYSYWSYKTNARQSNKGWRLDYFLTNPEFFKTALINSEINNDVYGSDHCPLELTLDCKKL